MGTLGLLLIGLLVAETSPNGDEGSGGRADNAIYVELNTLLVVNGISINYERRLLDILSIQVGYGASAVF